MSGKIVIDFWVCWHNCWVCNLRLYTLIHTTQVKVVVHTYQYLKAYSIKKSPIFHIEGWGPVRKKRKLSLRQARARHLITVSMNTSECEFAPHLILNGVVEAALNCKTFIVARQFQHLNLHQKQP